MGKERQKNKFRMGWGVDGSSVDGCMDGRMVVCRGVLYWVEYSTEQAFGRFVRGNHFGVMRSILSYCSRSIRSAVDPGTSYGVSTE